MEKKWITVKVNAALYISIDQIKPFQGDLKHLSDEAFNHLKHEIIDDGFTFAPHVWKHDKWYYILDGHQRIHVLTKLLKEGYCLRDSNLDPVEGIPCCTIEAEDINDAKRKVHQSVAQYGRVTQEGFDLFTQGLEIDLDNFDIPMVELPETDLDIDNEKESSDSNGENAYTNKIKAPIYQPTGNKPRLDELVNTSKAVELVSNIRKSKIPEDEKAFLIHAAQRHLIFNYQNIAEYYAHSSKETQELMEDLALVVIDFDKAIEKGFVVMANELAEAYKNDNE